MKKRIFTFVAMCFCIALVHGQGKKLAIAVTFNAMEELTRAVVKDMADISLIIPEGMEPHEAEPTPKNLIFLSSADVLIYNGFGMEFYLEKTLAAVGNKKLHLIKASKGVEPIILEKEHEHEGESGHHHHGNLDPHVWLSPVCAISMVKNIKNELSKLDKKNAKLYAKNAKEYIKKLEALVKQYKSAFAKLKSKRLVASHAAFGYLCRDFGLVQSSIQDVFAEGEPSPKEMAELVEYCRKHNIKVIFSEEVASEELAVSLSREVGGKVVKIYTMEVKEEGKDFLSRMQENLKRILENL